MRRLIRFPFPVVAFAAAAAVTWMTVTFAQDGNLLKPVEKDQGQPQLPANADPGPKKPTSAEIDAVRARIVQDHGPYTVIRSLPVPEHPAGAGGLAWGFPPAELGNVQSQEDREFDRKTHDLVAKYRDLTDEGERAEMKAKLTELVAAQFTIRQKQRQQELQQLEDQLKKLRAIQDKREAARAEIVSDRVNHLIREAQGLSWGAAPMGPPRLSAYAAPSSSAMVSRPASVVETNLNVVAQKSPVVGPPGKEEVKIFKIQGDGGTEHVNDLVTTIETLISGPDRPHVLITAFGSKIVARGQHDALKLVEEMINKLQEDPEGARDVKRTTKSIIPH